MSDESDRLVDDDDVVVLVHHDETHLARLRRLDLADNRWKLIEGQGEEVTFLQAVASMGDRRACDADTAGVDEPPGVTAWPVGEPCDAAVEPFPGGGGRHGDRSFGGRRAQPECPSSVRRAA